MGNTPQGNVSGESPPHQTKTLCNDHINQEPGRYLKVIALF
jgi:hypothetical protein